MEIEMNIKVNFTVKCELTENELRALDAIVGYGTDEFLRVFYKHMGESYLKPHEKDVRLLFTKIESLRSKLHEIDEARRKLLQYNS